MSSYAIRQEYNLQSVIWMVGGAIYTVARWVGSIDVVASVAHLVRWVRLFIAYLVSWEAGAIVALKTAACAAVIVGGLAVTVMFPAAVVFVFVVWVALMLVKKW